MLSLLSSVYNWQQNVFKNQYCCHFLQSNNNDSINSDTRFLEKKYFNKNKNPPSENISSNCYLKVLHAN